MSELTNRELREGWEVRPWCGELGTDHILDLDQLMSHLDETQPPGGPFRCSVCGEYVYTVTDAEDREHLIGRLVTVEPFVIEEEPW